MTHCQPTCVPPQTHTGLMLNDVNVSCSELDGDNVRIRPMNDTSSQWDYNTLW